jgi:hypothetical protein
MYSGKNQQESTIFDEPLLSARKRSPRKPKGRSFSPDTDGFLRNKVVKLRTRMSMDPKKDCWLSFSRVLHY